MLDLELNPFQKRLIASALAGAAAAIVLGLTGLVLFWLSRFLVFFSHVFMPIAVAAIAALVMKPYYHWLYLRTGHRTLWAVLLVYASLVIPLSLFVWFFGSLMWEQLTGLAVKGWDMAREGWQLLLAHWPDLLEEARAHDWDVRVKAFLEERMAVIWQGAWSLLEISASAGASIFRFIGGLFSWAIFPIYLGFFLAFGRVRQRQWESLLPFLRPSLRRDVIYLGREFVTILVSFFRGQLVIALLQGILYALGFSLIGLQYGFILGLLLGFMNIVPYLGSIIGLSIAIPLGFFQMGGGWQLAVAVVVVFTVVQLIESYVLTPRIMGDRTGLHPLVIIIAIFFWGTALNGIWGMILAIPLTAFGVVFWRLLKEKYIIQQNDDEPVDEGLQHE